MKINCPVCLETNPNIGIMEQNKTATIVLYKLICPKCKIRCFIETHSGYGFKKK